MDHELESDPVKPMTAELQKRVKLL